MKIEANKAVIRNIESLHLDSVEWMSDMEFWGNEARFFQKLLNNKMKEIHSQQKQNILQRLQQRLKVYMNTLLPEYVKRVAGYEHMLAFHFNPTNGELHKYNNLHHLYSEDIGSFEKSFQQFRKEIFEFVK